MTIHIPLSTPGAGPSKYASWSSDPQDDLAAVVRTLRSSKKMVVVSGAGVSTAADIPDFRSSTGLFHDNGYTSGKGKARGDQVKDLFHVKCLSSSTLLAQHYSLITSLASLAISANPTCFHSYLSELASSGRLLRCYTQNIDNLESKAGLQVGIPLPKKPRGKSQKQKATTVHENRIPEVIPLHGLLDTLHCVLCQTVIPLEPYLPLPEHVIPCPTCQLASTIRAALSERTRRSGHLRASVILYGEEHPQGDLIGSIVEKDLKSVDCLLVIGTSLSVPGVKRIVKEMSKSTKARKGKVILVNDEYPKGLNGAGSGGGDWRDIFDFWLQIDIQSFIKDYLTNEDYITSIPKEEKKIPITPRKMNKLVYPPTPESLDRPSKAPDQAMLTPTKSKKRKEIEVVIPTPTSTMKRKYVKRQREVSPSPMPKGN
ncbi:uncharacterized protein IL334_005249 [Kwoniella shivajii]|uniref:Deacetylase sirtuin-type domain-containing protein n=1 Tax=Kwoniella shivajii TaxID=564305 RepID=A0ABZ1D2M1_9TREE|nr:hypothetical protein IL334_005249 [Kwoniella shivajii]